MELQMTEAVRWAGERAHLLRQASERERRQEKMKEGMANLSSSKDKWNFMRKKKYPKYYRGLKMSVHSTLSTLNRPLGKSIITI